MSEHLTDRNFWEAFWKSKKGLIFKIKENYVFGDLLADIVRGDKSKSAIELGGFPGYYSIYFRKYLKLDTTLFDYFISKPIIDDLLAENDLKADDIKIIEADLFNYRPKEHYDIVSSFGLIEHFTDTKDIITHHLKFLKPGGTLFITLPNFKSVNGWVQKNFDHENYLKHNIACMDLDFLANTVKELGLTEIKTAYHGKFTVWLENKEEKSMLTKVLIKAIWWAGKIPTKIFGFESKSLSPYIVLQAKK
ncbi:MAG: class I SAM-dependent methyltransferase [Sphingobacteriaceae bacterium]